ncbi:hypothetical protein CW664_01710 [Macrococcoides caseolyticum]|uniref:hypothetical protein n=1 Tax=Macrococcoides caseolyticum TaxID=69966 RepID=UPI000C336738|nr:hypothetical protein [Macrococcus caseolyticus]PKF46485.1 hypothetical protein CW664_01710 [Macrococcus caseolyticus]
MKYNYSDEDLFIELIEQLQHLIDLCNEYDSGKYNKSKFICSTIRTLVHEGTSTSLLNRMREKYKIKYLDYAPEHHKNAIFFVSLLNTADVISNESLIIESLPKVKTIFIPRFIDYTANTSQTDFNHWWNKKILILDTDKGKLSLTRKKLITTMANKDGGSHVDSTVDKYYYDLTRGISSIYTLTSKPIDEDPYQIGIPIPYPLQSMVRQIAHELIISIDSSLDLGLNYSPNIKGYKILSIDINIEQEIYSN